MAIAAAVVGQKSKNQIWTTNQAFDSAGGKERNKDIYEGTFKNYMYFQYFRKVNTKLRTFDRLLIQTPKVTHICKKHDSSER